MCDACKIINLHIHVNLPACKYDLYAIPSQHQGYLLMLMQQALHGPPRLMQTLEIYVT